MLALLVLAMCSQPAGGTPKPRQPIADPAVRPVAATAAAIHPLEHAVRYARQTAANADRLVGYRARMVKSTAKGRTLETDTIDVKFRSQPFSVYMHFHGPNEGREVLFIEGWNGNKLLAHEGSGALSLVGSISLDPESKRAMQSGGRSIRQAGLANLGRGVAAEWAEAIRNGIRPDEIKMQRYPEAKLGDRAVEAVEVTLARPATRSRVQTTRFYVDAERKVPVAFQSFGFAAAGQTPPLLEDVRYLNVDFDRVPTPQEFDPKNPAYDF